MQRLFSTALFFTAIILYFKPVGSIKCYVCRSDKDSACNGELSNSSVQECPPRPNAIGQYCRKINQKLLFKGEDSITVIRECAYERSPRECYKSEWVYAAYQETCECDEDLCNASSHVVVAGTLTVVVVTSLPLWAIIFS